VTSVQQGITNAIKYGISRRVPAQGPDGKPCEIALVVIEHENGFMHRFCIPEEKIRFEGEEIIEREVQLEAAKGGIEYAPRN
jgi:hypothetical protein